MRTRSPESYWYERHDKLSQWQERAKGLAGTAGTWPEPANVPAQHKGCLVPG